MQPAKSILHRLAALLPCVAFALVVSGCDGNENHTLPTGPPIAPPPPTTLPASEEATPGTYRRVSPQFPDVEQRYVLDSSGNFRLQYVDDGDGLFEYLGNYSRQGSWYVFDFDANAGRWAANASFRGNCVVVEYNLDMELSDFVSGEYCR